MMNKQPVLMYETLILASFFTRKEIEKSGIRKTDLRLSKLMDGIAALQKELGAVGKVQGNINVDFETFRKWVSNGKSFMYIQKYLEKNVIVC